MRRIIPAFLAIGIGIAAFLYWRQSRPVPFVVSGFIEADEIRVGSRVGGRVSKVMTEEGQEVKPNDLLYELDPFDLQHQAAQVRAALAASNAEFSRLESGFRKEEIEQARAKRDQAQANYEKLLAGPRKQEIEVARAQLEEAQAVAEFAKTDYERLQALQEQHQAAPTEMSQALKAFKSTQADVAARQASLQLLLEGSRKEDIAVAAAKLAEAKEALGLMESGSRKEDIAKAQANVNAARAQVAAIESELSELQVLSPCKCVVEAIELQPGDMVNPNAPSVALLDLSNIWIRAYVPESRLVDLKLGQQVAVRVDGLPNETFRAEITFRSTEGEFTPKNIQTPEERSKQVFRIKASLRTGLDRLRVGMAADIFFDEKAPS